MATQHQTPSFGSHRGIKNPALHEKLRHMALPLAPLVQITTGTTHPAFPATLLNFWLLTDTELEELAAFYHQRTPSRWSRQYPCPVTWNSDAGLETKRRRLGRFIGLRNCHSPLAGEDSDGRDSGGAVVIKTEEEILEEARRAREMNEDEMWKRKLPWYQ